MHRADGLVGGAGGADILPGKPGDAEIGDLDGAVRQQHNVLRLDVTVYDALVVGMLERPQDLDREVDRFLPLDVLLLLDVFLKGDAVDVLHDDILQARAKADIVHLDDVGMGEDGNRLGFIF